MKQSRPSSEDEVIACFLRAEIMSPRWSPTLMAFLTRDQMPRRVLERPDHSVQEENAYRRRLLGEFRGWGRHMLLFRGFPTDISWFHIAVTPDELAQVQYINWSYWLEISGGSRLAKDVAARIRSGWSDEHRATFEHIAAQVRAGTRLPKLIVVTGLGPHDRIVVVEGHARLTGYLLAEDALPDTIEMFLGRSPTIGTWGLY